MLEKRQQQIRELRIKHERLRVELDKAKSRLMLDQDKWRGECKYILTLDQSIILMLDRTNGGESVSTDPGPVQVY